MKKGFLYKNAVAGIMALSILLLPSNSFNISDNLYTASAENYSISVETSSYTDEVIMLVNEERAKKGIAPLKTSPLLNQLAQIRSEEITTLFSHTRPDGTDGYNIIYEYGLSYSYCGENIAAGQNNPENVMTSWINSSGHYTNIINANYNYIGVGFVYVPNSEYGYYWTQIFYKSDDFFENEYIPEETIVTTTESESIIIGNNAQPIITTTESESTTIVTTTEPIITTTESESTTIETTTEPIITTTESESTTIESTTEPIITTTESESTTIESTTEPIISTIIGDINCDSIIDIRDITFLNQYIVQLVTFDEQQMINADTDRNGEVNIKDLGQLKKYLIKIIDKL